MSIYKTAVNKPITTLLIFVAVIVLGIFAMTRLPIDQLPEIDPPYISVMTTYPGANGSEIETNVTKMIENTLNSTDGLKEITSTSKDNISVVMLEFQWGMNLDEVVGDIRSYLDMVYDNLPDGCSRPIVFKFNSSSMPIMQYAITADESYSGLERILEDNVINVLNRVDGIGNLSLSGAPERYVYVDLDQNKADAYNLSVEAVGQAIQVNNLNLASGTVKMGKESYQLRVEGEFVESSEINDIVVMTTPDGKQVFIKDIATVRDTIKDFSLEEKINGKDGVRLIVMKQSGGNTVQVASDVRKEMEKIQKTLPPDIQIQMIYDSSESIRDSIFGLGETILYALLFVVLVVLFFMGKWRATLIIALTIPISLIVAFIYLLMIGSSLNIISLASLTVAIGMVVDDAIVVLENIDKHIERGASPREAAIYATNEVWVAVIATTLVIVAVFVPLTMLPGMAGIMFKELGWIVTITVVTSTVVAISLTPMLSSKLLKARNPNLLSEKAKKRAEKNRRFTYQNTVVRMLDKLDAWYAKVLRYCLRHKAVTLLVAALLFGASLIPVFTGMIGTNFMPQSDDGRMNITIELENGTRVEETVKTARRVEEAIMRLVPETELISSSAGSNDDAGISALFSSTTNNKISMTVRTNKKSERERSIFEISEVIRGELEKMPEIITYMVTNQSGGMGSNDVSVEIFGYDFDKTNALAEDYSKRFAEIKGARDISISRDKDRSELQIVFDKEKISKLGLNQATVSTYVRNRINGMAAGYLREDGNEYDIVVRLEEESRNSISALEEITLMTPQGKKIKLKEVAEIQEYWGPPDIERKRRERVVTVSVTPVNTSLGELATEIQKEIDKTEIPQGVLVNVGGSYEDQQEMFGDMAMLLILIVMLVYIVMAAQFESFSKPFIIMMSLPFAFMGVIIALLITGTALDMIGALGAILLVGIVVKNGIVLVDYINLMRDRGHSLYEAIALSGQSRLRPVLMTAATTILGMLPMALSTSQGSEMWVPMGIVVIGGLLTSTVVTLIVVPVFYGVMSRSGERDKAGKVQRKFFFMDMPDVPNEELRVGETEN
ncbi:efflux RND transporter permease subunit [Bacteroidales bacterium OttesenSCG-928-B11]|nr:efflux RND transporter permease subunit [Bacteroidales bacterium OttesenSCG-928-C03]MDL2311660.1 efflux RND transporter permease subunit [Bacteroidales bacterium OttesenSCG-928-B11]MDL2325769.1 efflux RND transporter permease subunit [Bacteroidales bacterium OttesenSCG-928-A14]